jgi:hypothetical protein
MGRENIWKPKTGSESLQEVNNDNGVAASKDLSQKYSHPTS